MFSCNFANSVPFFTISNKTVFEYHIFFQIVTGSFRFICTENGNIFYKPVQKSRNSTLLLCEPKLSMAYCSEVAPMSSD